MIDKTVQAVVVSKQFAETTAAAMDLVPKEFMTNSFQEDDDSYSFIQYRADLFDADTMNTVAPEGWSEGVTVVTGDFRVEPECVTGYFAPDSNAEGFLDRVKGAVTGKAKQDISVVKAADGSRYMLLITSNAYKDREDETITTPTLQEDVERNWRGDVFVGNDPLLIWHDERLKIGDIVFADVKESFLVEVAKEDKTLLAKAAFDYYESPDEPTGASHKFAFYRHDKDGDGTYHRIRKMETSILPRSVAANSLTFGGVIPMTEDNKDVRNEYIGKLFNIETAGETLDGILKKINAGLHKQGVEHKSTDVDEQVEKTKEAFDDLILGLIDGMADLDERVEKQSTAEKAYNDSRAELEKEVQALTKQVGELKIQLDNRPRQASRATETTIEGGDLPKDVRDSLTEVHPMWGRVKPKV